MANEKLNIKNEALNDEALEAIKIRLVTLRRLFDLTQDELAQILGITRSIVAKNERLSVTVDYLQRFEAFLDYIDENKKLDGILSIAIADVRKYIKEYRRRGLNISRIDNYF